MTEAYIWLVKMILSHLVTDFILQPKRWIDARTKKHFASAGLYLHGVVTSTLAFAITGFHYWWVAAIILFTHVFIDGWKSYRPKTTAYFIIDQLAHVIVIIACWYSIFFTWHDAKAVFDKINSDLSLWKTVTAFVFLTVPAGIFIGQLTKQWQDKIDNNPDELANAGKWIGISERIIVLILVLYNQYSAIGLLITAKGIIRFSEKDRPEIKTEYLVIGTLLSIGLAILTGLAIKG